MKAPTARLKCHTELNVQVLELAVSLEIEVFRIFTVPPLRSSPFYPQGTINI